jgi:hypothetical protein
LSSNPIYHHDMNEIYHLMYILNYEACYISLRIPSIHFFFLCFISLLSSLMSSSPFLLSSTNWFLLIPSSFDHMPTQWRIVLLQSLEWNRNLFVHRIFQGLKHLLCGIAITKPSICVVVSQYPAMYSMNGRMKPFFGWNYKNALHSTHHQNRMNRIFIQGCENQYNGTLQNLVQRGLAVYDSAATSKKFATGVQCHISSNPWHQNSSNLNDKLFNCTSAYKHTVSYIDIIFVIDIPGNTCIYIQPLQYMVLAHEKREPMRNGPEETYGNMMSPITRPPPSRFIATSNHESSWYQSIALKETWNY